MSGEVQRIDARREQTSVGQLRQKKVPLFRGFV
jgi:hypothetical protein